MNGESYKIETSSESTNSDSAALCDNYCAIYWRK